ncbi:hypothetical protein HOL21_03165 [Candidatus Woesearchaeota archaeon]|nr:hypothetical protein [Candidatus Woesearchaeota archaeon]MBT5397187.1 hypothetical protein [Candidatus Woesearchaeota archaeon]MBT5924824.1 hypothetical protein [Candidatus Woesearchaeota archaeon]MBT6367267.1 hypothetical protein [Candidatus Woesearchaeota archaeon]MBT7762587.1 hypothetical protein [Candidatus Woesearchaeota archaeon]
MVLRVRSIKAMLLVAVALTILIVFFIIIFSIIWFIIPFVIILIIVSYLFRILNKLKKEKSNDILDVKYKVRK